MLSWKIPWEVVRLRHQLGLTVAVSVLKSWPWHVQGADLILYIGSGRVMPSHASSSFISACLPGAHSVHLITLCHLRGYGVIKICVWELPSSSQLHFCLQTWSSPWNPKLTHGNTVLGFCSLAQALKTGIVSNSHESFDVVTKDLYHDCFPQIFSFIKQC